MFTDLAFWLCWAAGSCAIRGLSAGAVRARAFGLAGLVLVLRLPAAHAAVLIAVLGWVAFSVGRLKAEAGHPIRQAAIAVAPMLALWIGAKHNGLASSLRVLPLAAAGLSYLVVKAWTVARDRADGRAQGYDPVTGFAYLVFLPTYLSGPMHYYGEFEAGLRQPLPLRAQDAVHVVYRFLVGLLKVQVLVPLLTPLSLLGLTGGDVAPPAQLITGSLVYSVVLYLDFSGYSDLAIATARAAGVGAPENFLRPYLAPNIREFWRRWHVSFSRVLMAYLFVPVTRALQRRATLPHRGVMAAGYLVTFGLAGYWHGPTWRFVVWELYHACGLIAYDLFRQRRLSTRLASGQAAAPGASGVMAVLRVAGTLLFVSLGWLFFVPGLRLW